MPFAEGTGTMITTSYKPASARPSKDAHGIVQALGAANSRYNSGEAINAYIERNTTKVGFFLGIYDAELTAILGPEFS